MVFGKGSGILLDRFKLIRYYSTGVKDNHLTSRRRTMDDRTLEMTMLFDFYGELLTEKQQEYIDLYYNEDLSLSEIAEKSGISRQGVYDIITRAEKTLKEIEQKCGIIGKWQEARAGLKLTVEEGGDVHPIALGYFQLEKEWEQL